MIHFLSNHDGNRYDRYGVNLCCTWRNYAVVAPPLSPTGNYVPRGGISSLITPNLSYAFLHNHGLSLTLYGATVISVNRSIANLHLPQLRVERLGLGKGINCSSSWTNPFSWFNMSVPGGGGKEEGLWRDNKWRDSISDCSPQTRSLRSVCLSFHLSDSGDPLLILEQPASIPFPWPLLTREEILDEPRRVLNPRWKRREHKPHSRPKNNRGKPIRQSVRFG